MIDDVSATVIKVYCFIGGVILGYVTPASTYLSFMFALILVDSFFGLLTINKRGQKFEVRKLVFNGLVLKIAVYSTAIIMLVKLHELFFSKIYDSEVPLLVLILFIIWYEAKSIFQHFMLLRGGSVDEDTSTMKAFFNWLRGVIDAVQGKRDE